MPKCAILAVLASLLPLSVLAQTSQESSVDDVVVVGRRTLEATANHYVTSVTAAPQGREAAIWRDYFCVGVMGLPPHAASGMADRISDWAHAMGVKIAGPNCRPNVVVITTVDGQRSARELIAARPRDFETGASGTNRGSTALATFRDGSSPVRWWHVSLPTDENTGRATVRFPRQAPPNLPRNIRGPADLGQAARPVGASRLLNQDRDDLKHVMIVIDVKAFEQVPFSAVADYVSMIALAQVNPDIGSGLDSILNLFTNTENTDSAPSTLTHWDQAYLRALYGSRVSAPHNLVADLAAATAREASAGP